MEITKMWLEARDACSEGVEWFLERKETDPRKLTLLLLENDHFDWANWLIVRLLTKDNNVWYAIHAAEAVLNIYEKKYPEDNRPRKAIQAVKAYLKARGVKRKAAARAAQAAAGTAAWAAWAAQAAAGAAAQAAARAAQDAQAAAWAAQAAAGAAIKQKIIRYGLKLYATQMKNKKEGG